MKRLFIAVILSLAALHAFSQDAPPADDPYAKFQGVWGAKIEDGNTYFIFENKTVSIFGYDGGENIAWFCYYTLSSNKIIFHTKRVFLLDSEESPSWQSITPDDLDDEEFDGIFEGNYVFSRDKLILIFDGDPFTLSKID